MISKLLDEPYLSDWSEVFCSARTYESEFVVLENEFKDISGILISCDVWNASFKLVSHNGSKNQELTRSEFIAYAESNLPELENQILRSIYREYFDKTANMIGLTDFMKKTLAEKAEEISLKRYSSNRNVLDLILYARSLGKKTRNFRR